MEKCVAFVTPRKNVVLRLNSGRIFKDEGLPKPSNSWPFTSEPGPSRGVRPPKPRVAVESNLWGTVMVGNLERARVWLCFLLAGAAISLPPEARGEGNIGVASVVRNDVTGVLVSGTVKVNSGASVFSEEVMKTAKDSSAKLVFTDSTNLAIGPNSTVKLNHFVFSGPSSYGKATINVAKGAFRFTTGHSDKGAYELSTGTATIGVRGTIIEGQAAPRITRLRLVEGAAHVCAKNKGEKDKEDKRRTCCEVKAGEAVMVTDTACMPAADFDPGFDSELTEVQEFSQVQASEQTIFSAENPAIYVVAGAAIAGGVATAVTVSTNQSPPNNSRQELLLWLASHQPQPTTPSGIP